MTTKKRHQINNIWLVTREYGNLAGSGGVKDFCLQLASALKKTGKSVNVVLPLYGFMDPQEAQFRPNKASFEIDMHYPGRERKEYVNVWSKANENQTTYLIEAQRFKEKKDVYTYTLADENEDPMHKQGSGHYDYFAMNVLLQKAAIALIMALDQKPDIIHCQDGHTALLPAMIRELEGFRYYFNHTGCLVTIHNAGRGYHQEVGDLPFAKAITGLPDRVIAGNLLNGTFDPLLAASSYAVMNTVSENYARELQHTEDDSLTDWLGHRLLNRAVTLEGITNGIDPADYDPANPEKMHLAAAFDPVGNIRGKSACRAALVEWLHKNKDDSQKARVKQFGFLDADLQSPLFTFIGRLTSQKGVDKLTDALETMLSMDNAFQALLLGSGSKEIEAALSRIAMATENNGRLCVLLGYDPVLANQIYAAGDFFLIPSQYEPCGLTDYIAQLFGNIPIVHHVGGLVKVIDGVTGFTYAEHSSAALMGTMLKALEVFRTKPEKISQMQKTAVKHIHQNYTWEKVVKRYEKLYSKAKNMLV